VLFLLLLSGLLPGALRAQSLRKLERKAINRTRITLVNGDTIQRFTTTLRQPTPQTDRLYYWQGQDHILRTMGAYNGHLLDGPYQLTDRTDRLLGAGTLKKGLKTGTWRKWRADGSLVSSSHWRRGRQRGQTMTYDANSQPIPVTTPPKSTASTAAVEKRSIRWWQLTYWKAKFKSHKKPSVSPTPSATPTALPPGPKKKRAAKSTPSPPVVPKPMGS
jgi:hypothetical protein